MFISETNILIKSQNEKLHITLAAAISRRFVHGRQTEATCLFYNAKTSVC